ncbi:transcriptional regulator, TetR family [Sanguibacter gelidistatuariae]|uniref:Transcriptional regulator, TetR family n=1 Tax=Sanguibacter gelidistatuariae TaxID=1814289 RepID=A0A1G6K0A1_9MICO|nr:TetR/AcrR family transcriptional regulator [Sanguibacter gelidistatuariae]SDC24308.1 transcriptional regulator, TetR family [Sanguibacter gelidistatuariae]
MNAGTPAPMPDPGATGSGRSRDAGNTRQLLLAAARSRFARDGYAATTVRDIAADAGVNVALINRYFTSKEGLFEACLSRAAQDLGRADATDMTIDQVVASVLRGAMNSRGDDGRALQMLLLLRSSGDEGADTIRRNILQSFAERMAVAAGWRPSGIDAERLLLRAQIALSAALGIVQLRSTGLEPLASATEDELGAQLRDVLTALLSSPSDSRP